MSTAIPKNVHGEVRGTAIYVYSNPEKNIHGVDTDDERCKRQIAMCRDDVGECGVTPAGFLIDQ